MKKIQIMESSQVKALPLGAQTENGSVHVAFVSDREGTARIHLYKKGRDAEACSFVFPEENRLGDVRYIGLSGFAPSEYEYSLSVNGETVEDPYARLTAGREKWGIAPSGERSARYAFLREDFDWEDDRKPGYAFEDTILYRLHVRGFTRHPSSGVSHKGTFAGIAEKIPYLKELGVTMAELMLPYEFKEVREPPAGRRLPAGSGAAAQAGPVREADAPVNGTAPVNGAVPAAGPGGMAAVFPAAGYGGKLNYWGYGPACCFAPKAAYCVRGAQYGTPDIQFKSLVKEFHKNGLEIAVELYFEPDAGTPYILDCLRFWVEEYHVDGIHIAGTFDGKAVSEDPVLRGVKLFAGDWSRESAGKKRYLAVYRDDFQTDMRRFIKGDEDQLRNLVYHMKENGGAFGKVNFMANTNGFTMMDMVSYDRKHNEKNGEDGRDGTDYNYSWNCGAEGPARKRKILELRKKQLWNAWTILMTAQGMPLILAGDEFGNSQDGNNNAYCQDNATGWVEWKKGRLNDEIARFARFMIRFRKAHPMLHRAGGLRSMDYKGVGCPDFSVHGEAPWYPQYENYRRQLGLLYKGSYAGEEADSDLYIMFNMHWETHAFSLPHAGGQWHLAVYTADEERNGIYEEPELLEDQETFEMAPRSIAILTAKEAGI